METVTDGAPLLEDELLEEEDELLLEEEDELPLKEDDELPLEEEDELLLEEDDELLEEDDELEEAPTAELPAEATAEEVELDDEVPDDVALTPVPLDEPELETAVDASVPEVLSCDTPVVSPEEVAVADVTVVDVAVVDAAPVAVAVEEWPTEPPVLLPAAAVVWVPPLPLVAALLTVATDAVAAAAEGDVEECGAVGAR